MRDSLPRIQPGMRLRITQETPRLTGDMTTAIEGVVLRCGPEKTGSWFAHGQDDKLWVHRVELRKDNGELVVLNIDRNSRIENLDPASAKS